MRGRVKTYVLLCAVGILGFTSCDKPTIELPEPNDPVFTLEGTLGGEEFKIIAGDNNAFMNTSAKMVNGVQTFSGDLSDGNFSLEMGIYDGALDMPNHIPEDQLQNLTAVFANHPTEPLARLTKSKLGEYSQNIVKVSWYINNVFSGEGDIDIMEPGNYNVCAFLTFANGETDELCNDIVVGYKRSAESSIDYDIDQGYLNANINSIGSEVTEVKWFIDGDLVPGSTISQYQMDSSMFKLSAEIHFANNVVRTRTVLIDGENYSNCVNDFSIFEMSSNPNFVDQDFNLKLRIEHNGKTYLSEMANNNNSTVVITGVEYYGKNDAGKKVYKISGIVDAIVMELVTEKMVSVKFNTVFGIEVD